MFPLLIKEIRARPGSGYKRRSFPRWFCICSAPLTAAGTSSISDTNTQGEIGTKVSFHVDNFFFSPCLSRYRFNVLFNEEKERQTVPIGAIKLILIRKSEIFRTLGGGTFARSGLDCSFLNYVISFLIQATYKRRSPLGENEMNMS